MEGRLWDPLARNPRSPGSDQLAAHGLRPARRVLGDRMRLKHLLLGKPRDVHDPHLFHKISLIAFLAWVGLGADGLSSSAYGPDEAFRGILENRYLAVALALATAGTVFIISLA